MPNAEVKLNLNALGDISREALNASLETMGALRTEMLTAKVIPRNTGNLEESGGAIDQFAEGNEVHTTLCIGDTPYARRLYFHPEYNFQTVNNPNAQGEWAQPWAPGGDLEGFVPDTFASRLEERLK